MPIEQLEPESQMQGAAVDIAFETVLVFLFGTVAWVRRPDDRARCWFGGWVSLLGSSAMQVTGLRAAGAERVVFASIAVDLIAVAAIFFIVSAAIPTRGRRFGIKLWFAIAIPTLLCLALATTNVQSRWVLLAAVAVRQGPMIALSSTMRRFRPTFGLLLMAVCTISAGLMLYLILHGQARLVVPVILTEMYFVAGIDVWNKNLTHTIGMRVSSVGLLLWALVFPLVEIVNRMWPQIATDSEIWNPPRLVVAVGMILMVFEEEAHAARALARDYRLLFENNPNPLWIFDVESLDMLMANPAACALHGYTQEEFLGLKLPEILHPEVRERAISETKMPEPTPNRASRHIRKDGTEFPMDVTAHSVIFKGKTCRFVLGLDVTKREYLERKLEYEQDHDSLTGLANRRSFEEKLTDAVASATKSDTKLAVLCFDIYHFKRLNQIYGPRIGDECVQYVAGVLRARIRPSDFVARTGDDDFAVVLTELRDVSFAEEVTSYLTERFKNPISIGSHEIQLSFSLGVAVCPDDSTNAMALWHLGESALRRAQAKGNGEIVWLSPDLRADAEKTVEIAASMNRMLEEERFHLVYQPLYGEDGSMRGMEALLRLNHPRYGPVSPVLVIRTAEESGIIETLGQWLFERTCLQIQSWMDQGMRLTPVAINISSMQLMRKGFAERLAQTLQRHRVSSEWIHLEITETAAMDNLKAVSGEMRVLSALGCRFSIDDFGTGHSSLGRLHQLPISILKIDRSFIENLCHREGNGGGSSVTIVEAIVSMAHALGLQVVAEGVETEGQLRCLRRLGCDFYQGFLLSRPVMPEEIPALIDQKHSAFGPALNEMVGFGNLARSEEDRIIVKT